MSTLKRFVIKNCYQTENKDTFFHTPVEKNVQYCNFIIAQILAPLSNEIDKIIYIYICLFGMFGMYITGGLKGQ